MKETIYGVIGMIGALVASVFGGWTSAMTTLLIFMGIDFVSGLALASIFKRSPKTKLGALESNICFKGAAKKCMELFFVLVAYRLDVTMGTTYCKDAVCIAFIVNELVSIIENAGLMGLPIPAPITEAIEILKHKKE